MNLRRLWQTWEKVWFEPASPVPLCLFRIAYGLVLLEYCYLMAPELITCFSDINGILRIQTLPHIFGIQVINLLTNLPPGDNWIVCFFALFVLACVCLTFGLFTRLSIIIVYLGLVSFHHRNIFVMHSGDRLMCICAFLMLFAPIDACLSLDRLRRIWFSSTTPPDVPDKRSLWAFRAYQLQLALVYWQTSWAKLSSPMWRDGTALYYVFRHKEFFRFPLPLVPDYMVLIKLSTWAAVVIEFSAWTLIWFNETRYIVLCGLLALHLGIDYSMNIPLFEHIMIASLIVWIPAGDLTKLMNKVKNRAATIFGPPAVLTYNSAIPVHVKIARTVKSLDIFGRVRVVDIAQAANRKALPGKLPPEAKKHLLLSASDQWLKGRKAMRALSAKLPLAWPLYAVLALFS